MYVIIVPIQVKEGHKEEFVKASLLDAQDSVNDEPGCLRFDLIQDPGDPNRVWLYEIYKDRPPSRPTPRRLTSSSGGTPSRTGGKKGPGCLCGEAPTYGPRTPIGNREEACTY